MKFDRSHSVGASNRGYELIGGQGLQGNTLPDLNEGFYDGQEIPASDPRVVNNAFLIGPNLWPDENLIGKEVFMEPMSRYYDAMKELSLKALEVISKGMEYTGVDIEGMIREFTGNDAVCSIRLLHYPPDPSKGTDEKQFGAGAHTDFGAITLLLQDIMGGLQVWDYPGEVWRDIELVEGSYVVNVGDMLQTWTSGMYNSSLHRVLNKSGRDRYSVPFFFDGNVDFVLRPSDMSVREGGDLTVEGHMRERFASTYGMGKKI